MARLFGIFGISARRRDLTILGVLLIEYFLK
jgi:hypothetical protein